MRLRVASARALAPAGGAEVDGAAVQGILADIDATLAAVNGLAAGAPPDLLAGVEAVRNALVREAIDFSDLSQRIASAGAVAATAARVAPNRASQTRMLAVDTGSGRVRRPTALIVVLVLAVLGGGGFHLQGRLRRPAPPQAPTLPGAPDGLMLTAQGGRKVLVTLPGKKVDFAAMEAFCRRQADAGVEVRELAPGSWILEPVRAKGGDVR
jgi:hypothetical protein